MPGIVIPDRFKKRLDKKGKKAPALQAAILECIARVCDDPSHPGLRTKGVQGSQGVFESYVDRSNRLTWCWEDDCIVFLNHCNHDIVGR